MQLPTLIESLIVYPSLLKKLFRLGHLYSKKRVIQLTVIPKTRAYTLCAFEGYCELSMLFLFADVHEHSIIFNNRTHLKKGSGYTSISVLFRKERAKLMELFSGKFIIPF